MCERKSVGGRRWFGFACVPRAGGVSARGDGNALDAAVLFGAAAHEAADVAGRRDDVERQAGVRLLVVLHLDVHLVRVPGEWMGRWVLRPLLLPLLLLVLLLLMLLMMLMLLLLLVLHQLHWRQGRAVLAKLAREIYASVGAARLRQS